MSPPSVPKPSAGLVLHAEFVWPEDRARGRTEGKERPVCVVLIVARPGFAQAPSVVTVPITHRPPSDDRIAIEIPLQEKRRLRLDDERSWIILDVLNEAIWPDGVVRVAPPAEGYAYGHLSLGLLRRVRATLASLAKARRLTIVPRP